MVPLQPSGKPSCNPCCTPMIPKVSGDANRGIQPGTVATASGLCGQAGSLSVCKDALVRFGGPLRRQSLARALLPALNFRLPLELCRMWRPTSCHVYRTMLSSGSLAPCVGQGGAAAACASIPARRYAGRRRTVMHPSMPALPGASPRSYVLSHSICTLA